MTRWLRRPAEEPDREMAALLGSGDRVPGPSGAEISRSRAHIAAELSNNRGPSPLRRLAFASMGGGGMWSGLLSAAAAHKAASAAVGISVLLGGAAAEASGVGPAVREAVSEQVQSAIGLQIGQGSEDDPGQEQATEHRQNEGASEQGVGPAAGSNGGVEVSAGGEEPGNLVTQLHPSGSFTIRGVLVDADSDALTIETAEGDETIDLGADVAIRGPGESELSGDDLADFEGHLVFAMGTCDEGTEDLDDSSCELTMVQVLGYAGMEPPIPDQAGDAGASASDGAGGADDEHGQPDDVPPPHPTPNPEHEGGPDTIPTPRGGQD